MGLLTRDMILSYKMLPTEDVEIPEWGGKVRVKTLTGAERDAFEQASMVRRGKSREMNMQNLRARLCMATVVDEDDKPLFRPEDVDSLGATSAAALDRIFEVASKLNRLSKEDVEDLTKNS